MTHLESMTLSCSNGEGSAALLTCLHKSIDMLRVVCMGLASWYLPGFHLGDCSLFMRVVNQVLRWALSYTRQRSFTPFSEATKSAIARIGLLCVRTFQGLPPHMVSKAVCKLPPTTTPTLACFLCEQMPSRAAQDALWAATQDERSLIETLVDYLGPEGPNSDCRAMSKVLLSPAVLQWARMEFVESIPLPSHSAAVRQRERASAKHWPPCSSEARQAWNRCVTIDGHFLQAYGAGGYTSGSGTLDAFLSARMTVDPTSLLRALRIVGRNAPTGMVRSEVRGRESLILKQQCQALHHWQQQRGTMTLIETQRDRDMVFGMAAFCANTTLHWLRYGDSGESGVSVVLRQAGAVMAEMWKLVWEQHPGVYQMSSVWVGGLWVKTLTWGWTKREENKKVIDCMPKSSDF